MPGPIEASILADLAPVFRARSVEVAGGSLRVIEGGEGAPLVLIHGRGSAATTWAPLLPRLARTRRVLAVDLPGFGESRGYRFTRGGVDEAVAFFADPIAAWLAMEGLESAVIAGHSLGGRVAIELALRRVPHAALLLIAPMGVGPEVSLFARLFFRAGPERMARMLGARRFAALMGNTDPRAAALSFELHAVAGGRPEASAAFDVLAPLRGPAPHVRDRLRTIESRTLLIAGDRDAVFPTPIAIAAAAALPRGELCFLRAGHSPHLDQADAFVAALDGFLG